MQLFLTRNCYNRKGQEYSEVIILKLKLNFVTKIMGFYAFIREI